MKRKLIEATTENLVDEFHRLKGFAGNEDKVLSNNHYDLINQITEMRKNKVVPEMNSCAPTPLGEACKWLSCPEYSNSNSAFCPKHRALMRKIAKAVDNRRWRARAKFGEFNGPESWQIRQKAQQLFPGAPGEAVDILLKPHECVQLECLRDLAKTLKSDSTESDFVDSTEPDFEDSTEPDFEEPDSEEPDSVDSTGPDSVEPDSIDELTEVLDKGTAETKFINHIKNLPRSILRKITAEDLLDIYLEFEGSLT